MPPQSHPGERHEPAPPRAAGAPYPRVSRHRRLTRRGGAILALGLVAAALVPSLVAVESLAHRGALGLAVLACLGVALGLHLGGRGTHVAPPAAATAAEPRALEVEHRLRNLLATVTAVLQQSRRAKPDPAAALSDFERRLADLRRLHALLGEGQARRARVAELVELATAPYAVPGGSVGAGPARVTLRGPDVELPAEFVMPLGTALCELATNAAKHGALSGPRGHVDVAWTLEPSRAEGASLRLAWTERGGPAVAPPRRRGYGSALLERGLSAALGGEAHLEFAPEGLSCCLSLPLPRSGAHRPDDGRAADADVDAALPSAAETPSAAAREEFASARDRAAPTRGAPR